MKYELKAMLEQADEKLRAARRKKFTTLLTRMFEDRQSGDYDIASGLTEAEARQDVEDAKRIVDAVRHFLTA